MLSSWHGMNVAVGVGVRVIVGVGVTVGVLEDVAVAVGCWQNPSTHTCGLGHTPSGHDPGPKNGFTAE